MNDKFSLDKGMMVFYMMVMKMLLILYVCYVAEVAKVGVRLNQFQGFETGGFNSTFVQDSLTTVEIVFNKPPSVDSTNVDSLIHCNISVYPDSLSITPLPNAFQEKIEDGKVGWKIRPLFILPDDRLKFQCDIFFYELGNKFIKATFEADTVGPLAGVGKYIFLKPIEVVSGIERLAGRTDLRTGHRQFVDRDVTGIKEIQNLRSQKEIMPDQFSRYINLLSRGYIIFRTEGEYQILFSMQNQFRPLQGVYYVKRNRSPSFPLGKSIYKITESELRDKRDRIVLFREPGNGDLISDPDEDEFYVKEDPDNPLPKGAEIKEERLPSGYTYHILMLPRNKTYVRETDYSFIADDKCGGKVILIVRVLPED